MEFDFTPISKVYGPKDVTELGGLSIRSTLIRVSNKFLEIAGVAIPENTNHVMVGISIDTKKNAVLLYPDAAGFTFRRERKDSTTYACNTPTTIKKMRLPQGIYEYRQVEGIKGAVFVLKNTFIARGDDDTKREMIENDLKSIGNLDTTPLIEVGDKVEWPVELHGGGRFMAEGIVQDIYASRFSRKSSDVPTARITVGDAYKEHFPRRRITSVMLSNVKLVKKGAQE